MSASKQAARDRFDRWAPTYERDRRSRFNSAPREAAMQALDVNSDDRFLDVGCGSGAAVREAAARGADAVGVDIAPAMVARAEELSAGLGRVKFVVGDSERLPFADRAFTAVLCSSSFHHYPSPTIALSEFWRVLGPRGRLAIADPNGDLLLVRIADRILRRRDRSHVRLYGTAELRRLLSERSFASVEVRPLDVRGYLLATGRRP